jgi:hypothetical protein
MSSAQCIGSIQAGASSQFFLAHEPIKGAGFKKVIGAGSDIYAASMVPVGKTDIKVVSQPAPLTFSAVVTII